MSLDLATIRTAFKTRLTHATTGITSRIPTVHTYKPEITEGMCPAIVVDCADDYIDYYQTMSDSGLALVRFVLELHVAGRYIDAQMASDAYLSVGSGFTASILNALLVDKTLGGTVHTIVPLTAEKPQPSDDDSMVWVTRIPVDAYVRKVAA